MKIAIIHYHLHPGGVTRVIESQVRSFCQADKNAEIILFSGDSFSESAFPGVRVIEDNCLLYDESGVITHDFEEKTNRIMNLIGQHAPDFILHCHNPNLGKNPALTLAVYQLARQGFRVVNHCHDFAEDRPENMQ